MTHHHDLVREVARTTPRRRVARAAVLLVALAAVLAGARTERGVSFVIWLRAFLEFFSGVFTLVGLTGVVVAGLLASWRMTPIRLRVLAQSAHRAAAVMSMSFLATHILLKELERHASILDVLLPFVGAHGRVLWIGLGTIASDMMIIIFVTGVARGRYITSTRSWTWRALHITGYLCWPVALLHGLKAGRPAKDWVTESYLVCAAFIVLVALARLISSVRHRGAARRRGAPAPAPARPAPEPGPSTPDVPDERFWAELKAEAAQWTGSAR